MERYKYAVQIDTLRFIAIISIFMNHCKIMKLSPNLDGIYESYFHYGGIGVEFFILLSGFMAAYSFKQISYTQYLKNRFFRFFPVHLFCLLLFIPLLVYWSSNWEIFFNYGLSALLLQSCLPSAAISINGPTWTLSTLWVLCFITPFLVQHLKRIGVTYQLLSFVFSLFISFILNFFCYEDNVWFFYISPFYRIVTYTQGIVLAFLYNRSKEIGCNLSYTQQSLLEFFSVLLFVTELVCVSPYTNTGFYYTASLSFIIFIFMSGGGIFSRLLSNNYLTELSKLSFSFYVIHGFFCNFFTRNVIKIFGIETTDINLITIVIANFILSLISAALLRKYIEEIFTSYLRTHCC